MARAAKMCSTPNCPNLQPCDEHKKIAWEGSTRREKAIAGSRLQRRNRHVMVKYQTVCHVCGKHGADQVDHVVPLAEGGADTLENLRPIHAKPCHQDKTQAEAQRGQR